MDILETFINLFPITLLQGVIYGFVALGIMIPFRILSFPDLTAEGSFPLGGSVAAATIAAGLHPVTATLLGFGAGFLAGCATALIHLKLRLNTLLCGIIVLTMLYSVNIRIMGKPNQPIFAQDNLFDVVLGESSRVLSHQIGLVILMLAITGSVLLLFFKTEFGTAMRAVGANKLMARAQGISIWRHTILGIGLAGSLCSVGGALLAQNQSFADVNMGFGVLLNGLAAVIVGETLIGRESLARQIIAPIGGAVIYYQAISLALALGLEPSDLKFLTGAFVLVMLTIPRLTGQRQTISVRES